MGRIPLLLHPAFIGGVSVLALNDHVLKGTGPPSITGKLSDFAGVFVLAILGSVLVRRRLVGVALAGAVFVALKASPTVAELAAPLMGGEPTRQDPTDLVALVALGPAYLIAGSTPRGVAGLPRKLLLTCSLLAVLVTLTATSCSSEPRYWLESEGSRLLYFQDHDIGPIGAGPVAVSFDGGITWEGRTGTVRELTEAEQEDRTEEILGAKEACTEDGHCFRIVPGLYVEERTPGGEWTRTFDYTPDEKLNAQLHQDGLSFKFPFAFPSCGGGRDPLFGHTFVAVEVIKIEGVEHAVVAMGSQGALHKVVGGGWERVSVAGRDPLRVDEPSWRTALRLALLGTAVASLLLITAGFVWRRRRASRYLAGIALLLSLATAILSFPLMVARWAPAGISFAFSGTVALGAIALLVSYKPDPEGDAERERRRSARRTRRRARKVG